MKLPKDLPIAVDSFDAIIDRGCVYVDKTDLVAELAQKRRHYMFTRPRCFGKTTLVSTLHELFANGLERFKGLKIEQDGLYTDTKTYKVLHLDFSTCIEGQDFNSYLLQALTKELERNGIDFDDQVTYPFSLLEKVISREAWGTIVILIDDYDTPLTAVSGDDAELAKRKAIWHSFYAALKEVSGQLRFLFLTGITRYKFGSDFFGSFHQDLSLDSRFGSLLGYTQEELECYFGDYIERAACELNRVNNTGQYTRESVLQLLKQHYNGYCFDRRASTLVYNPWSILNFLDNPAAGFQNY